jgi:hypothetical protein
MKKMNNSTPKVGETNIVLGKKDIILNYKSKWPIYKLQVFDKKGLWLKFKGKMDELQEKKILKSITEDDIIGYYLKNLDVEFELYAFDEIMQKHSLFKVEDKIYSYSIGKKTKSTKNIAYVRFYFDLNEFFNY